MHCKKQLPKALDQQELPPFLTNKFFPSTPKHNLNPLSQKHGEI